MAVNGVGSINVLSPSIFDVKKTENSGNAGIPFTDYLKEAINDTSNLILQSEKLQQDFAAGRTENIHQVLIAVEKADVALQFTMQIRNKILDAYTEIMRMQI